MKKISLNSIADSVGSHEKLQLKIAELLDTHILLAESPNVIAFHALSLFNFKKGKFHINDLDSINAACLEVLTKAGVYKNAKIISAFERHGNGDIGEPIHHFITHIVGLYQMPFQLRRDIEAKAKEDLRKLLNLIDRYEQDVVIIEYKIKGTKRNEHETKVKLDFYKRCITERDIIVHYIVDGLDKRAIVKARQDPKWIPFSIAWIIDYQDRPYRWEAIKTMEYFDYKKIKKAHHRLGEVEVKKGRELESLYHNGNKVRFYRELKKYISPEQVFHGILTFYIKMLPKIGDREPIFRELRILFKQRQWYGFTALALTQVEGLFSDMAKITAQKQRVSSLSTKVDALRPLYKHDEKDFDYFEYELPRLRNHFLHYGHVQDEDFRYLSLDLLYDLHYLMGIFQMVKDPHIELHQLLKKDHEHFVTGIGSIVRLFGLVKTIRQRLKGAQSDKHLQDVLSEWQAYEKEVLAPSKVVEYYLMLANQEIDHHVKTFYDTLKVNSAYTEKKCDLDTLSYSELRSNGDELKTIVSNTPLLNFESYNYVMECYLFIKDYKTYLPNHSEETEYLANEIEERHRDNLKKLVFMNDAMYPK